MTQQDFGRGPLISLQYPLRSCWCKSLPWEQFLDSPMVPCSSHHFCFLTWLLTFGILVWFLVMLPTFQTTVSASCSASFLTSILDLDFLSWVLGGVADITSLSWPQLTESYLFSILAAVCIMCVLVQENCFDVLTTVFQTTVLILEKCMMETLRLMRLPITEDRSRGVPWAWHLMWH